VTSDVPGDASVGLITKDPFMMRRAGWMFLLAAPACVFAAWAYRNDGAGILGFIAVLGIAGVLGGVAYLRRAEELGRRSDAR
jgi:hypothetical protein